MSSPQYHRLGLDDDDPAAINDKKTLARKALLRDALIAVGGVIIGAVLALVLFRLRPPVDLDAVCGRYVSAYGTFAVATRSRYWKGRDKSSRGLCRFATIKGCRYQIREEEVRCRVPQLERLSTPWRTRERC